MARPDWTSPPPSVPSTGCAATSRTTWSRPADYRRPAPRHPGLQPLWRGAPADRRDDGDLRCPAGGPPGHRHAHLHLRHHARLHARRLRRGRQGALGAGPAQPRRPARSRARILEPGWESFVGAGPAHHASRPDLRRDGPVVRRRSGPGCRPAGGRHGRLRPRRRPRVTAGRCTELPWVNPSPNASSLNMARCFPGTVLFEGTTLSEGRGTTVALELVGAPDMDFERILARMAADCARMARGRADPALLLRADLPQARRPAVLGAPDPHRQRALPARASSGPIG